MPLIRSVCVYCGSGSGGDERWAEATRAFGRALADADVQLVYGGGGLGLMGTVAASVLEGGGRVVGIIPDFLVQREAMLAATQEHIVVPDMHTRKRLMFERSDAFVALPGGIGTLEELVEQLTWAQLGQHRKPILIADFNGYWRPLLDMLAHMRANGFIRAGLSVPYLVAETVDEILPRLEAEAERVRALGETPVETVRSEPMQQM
jgi:uncharacterized protein (TIGR00730 family)